MIKKQTVVRSDGTKRVVYRDAFGRFTSKPSKNTSKVTNKKTVSTKKR